MLRVDIGRDERIYEVARHVNTPGIINELEPNPLLTSVSLEGVRTSQRYSAPVVSATRD